MAQPATNAKIEELRFRLKTDPKSRLFYQLAEELRKASAFADSEQVLRSGLAFYPSYLAAWVSLGRVLREQKKDEDAVDALKKALQLDPGNVVAARLLGDSYMVLGQRVEALKKYKLVHALLPADEQLNEQIERLEGEIDQPAPEGALPEAVADQRPVEEARLAKAVESESPFDRTMPPFAESSEGFDDDGSIASAIENLVAEPLPPIEIDVPSAASLETAATEESEPLVETSRSAEVSSFSTDPFESDLSGSPPAAGNAASTVTMADLYVRQGLVDEARRIYEEMLSREPDNADIRAKLDAITPRVDPKVARLREWLARVSKREVDLV